MDRLEAASATVVLRALAFDYHSAMFFSAMYLSAMAAIFSNCGRE